MTLGTVDFACLCSLDPDENIVVYNAQCPLHRHLATPPKAIVQRWCSGSSMNGQPLTKRTGRCHACHNEVPMKYGITGVHLPDGSTPRE